MKCFTKTVKDLKSLAQNGSLADFMEVLCDPKGFPEQLRSVIEWQQISHKAVYVPLPADQNNVHHFDLNMPVYTHFTSPIRRYLDIIVHRFVNEMIEEVRFPPYEFSEVNEMCKGSSDCESNDKRYEEAMVEIKSSFLRPGRLIKVLGVVKDTSDKSMNVLLYQPESIMNNRPVTATKDTVTYSCLNLSNKPVKMIATLPVRTEIWSLSWLTRIYDPFGTTAQVLTHDQHETTVDIPIPIWLGMLESLKSEDIISLKATASNLEKHCHGNSVEEFANSVVNRRSIEVDDDEFSSEDDREYSDNDDEDEENHDGLRDPNVDESSDGSQVETQEQNEEHEYYRNTKLNIHKGKILQMWIRWQAYQAPQTCLITVSSDFDICTEHNRYPIECFSDVSTVQASNLNHPSDKAYQMSWLPAIQMESAVNAVEDAARIVLRGVPVSWRSLHNVIHGEFELGKEFCETSCVTFSPGDYICARIINTNKKAKQSATEDESMWTGHFLVKKSTSENEASDTVQVKIALKQSCQRFNVQKLEKQRVTLELLPQPVSNRSASFTPAIKITFNNISLLFCFHFYIQYDFLINFRRMGVAVMKIGQGTASELSRHIARGSVVPPVTPIIQLSHEDMLVPGLLPPNQPQEKAIRTAVNNRFALIQGPPGFHVYSSFS